ncbi:ester cyclase [Geodermatophilus sp. SYSU D00742]
MAGSEAMQVLQQLFEAYDGKDFSRYAALLAPDLVWEFNTMPGPLHGPDAELQTFRMVTEAFPDATFTRDHFVEDGTGRVAWRWRLTGTNTGPWQGQEPTGRPVDIIGATHATVSDGRVTELRYVSDRLTLMQQLGLLPTQR